MLIRINSSIGVNLFTISIFLASAQLFIVQPMFAKRLLPMLGGTPSVWTTCMLFYQVLLLGGYVYAHIVTSRWSLRTQLIVHGMLLLLPFAVFAAGPPVWQAPDAEHIVEWLLSYLLVAVGLPFFLLSTNAPLVQRWYANTLQSKANKAYGLYSASNAGSLVALIAYPFLIEPHLTLKQQYDLLAVSYFAFVFTMGLIIFKSWKSAKAIAKSDADTLSVNETSTSVGYSQWKSRLHWIFLAFIPSSLLLSVTTYITTNIAPCPMFWLIPLALYLLTFIIAFSPFGLLNRTWTRHAHAVLLVALCMFFYWTTLEFNLKIMFPLHLATFFVTALMCHTELAATKPNANKLTEFYLCLALGGAVGGIFNALIAPMIFTSLVEYPVVLALSCLARKQVNLSFVQIGWRFGATMLCVSMATIALYYSFSQTWSVSWMFYRIVIVLAPAAVCCLASSELPFFMMLCISVMLFVGANYSKSNILYQGRNTFGSLIVQSTSDSTHYLTHGNILHGAELMNAPRPHDALAYYHSGSPIGHIFSALEPRLKNANIAVVGLGSGTMATFAQPNQRWTFYEINPLVLKIASDEKLFTYLTDCRAEKTVVIGDGRQSLSRARDKEFNLIAFDAFSSDAIPVHLITKEAIQLYLSKLADGGILVFHISNRSIDLKPILRRLAENAGLTSMVEVAGPATAANPKHKLVSTWFVMARNVSDLDQLRATSQFAPPPSTPKVSLWTDDFSNLLETFKLN